MTLRTFRGTGGAPPGRVAGRVWTALLVSAVTLGIGCVPEPPGASGPDLSDAFDDRADLVAPADSLDTREVEAAPGDAADSVDALAPAPPVLVRLTQRQLRHALDDLFLPGLALPSTLEPDAPAEGLLTAGGSVTSVSGRGVELYEDLALSVGEQVMRSPERRAAVLTCQTHDGACLEAFVRELGRRVWRRPLVDEEVTALTGIAFRAEAALGTFEDGLAWVIAAMLQSPNFLYRFEAGEVADGGLRRFTSVEMASRLAFFLWASPPDLALLDAGERGELVTEAGLSAQVDRMLADPKARRSIRGFFSEWLQLHELARLNKDPNIFKHFSPDLGALAAEETLRLAEHLFVDEPADLRDLLLTRTAFIDRRLAAIYNVPAPVLEGFGRTELPLSGERRGFLGQVSFLAMHSHPTSSSATLRGVFLRETLLCQHVPDPPSDLNTAIPEPSPELPTLRDRLAAHREDPSCASCHQMTDVPGLGFELFDGIGRFRLTENGAPIDPSGRLAGVDFSGPSELAVAIADNPRFTACAVQKLYSYAVARPTTRDELTLLDTLTDAFVANGRQVDDLMRAIAMSPGFRLVGTVEAAAEVSP